MNTHNKQELNYKLWNKINNSLPAHCDKQAVDTAYTIAIQEISTVLERLKKEATLLVEQDPLDETYREDYWVNLESITALQQEYKEKV